MISEEFRILQTIGWKLCAPTVCTFLSRFLMVSGLGGHIFCFKFSHCLCERIYLDYQLLRFPPSLIAASVVKLTRVMWSIIQTFDEAVLIPWGRTMELCSGYREQQLDSCIRSIQQSLWKEVRQRHGAKVETGDSTLSNAIEAEIYPKKRAFDGTGISYTMEKSENTCIFPSLNAIVHKYSIEIYSRIVTLQPVSHPDCISGMQIARQHQMNIIPRC